MLSLGAAAFDHHGRMHSTFQTNLETLNSASAHPDTIAFWAKHPEAYKRTRIKARPPDEAMTEFVSWLERLPDRPVLVGYPITFDFMFVYWYIMKFVGKSPCSFSGLDIKTLAYDRMRVPYRDVSKKTMPTSWFPETRGKKHDTLDDAISQGHLFFNVLGAKK